jgi:hypothetical protein
MLQKLMEGTDRNYITLDDLNDRQLAQNDPEIFFQLHKPPVLIDEVQYAPELFPYIKILIGKNKKPGEFWLTGSQTFGLMKLAGESLAGRVEKLFLGHIHTHRQVCKDVYYTGALIRNTFGEEKETSGAWHMDRDLNVTDVPLEGARKMVTIQMDDMAEVMNGGLEERLSDVISSDPDVMVRIRIPGGAASSEYASEIVKRTEEKWSEPGRNVIISDFSLPKPEKDKGGQEEHKLKADTSSDGRSVAEQISVKGLWSSYCKERLGLIGAPEEDIAVAEICGEALLSGTPPSDIWKAMKEGRFSEIRTELAEKERAEIPESVSPPEPSRGPVILEEEDLEEITLDIDI